MKIETIETFQQDKNLALVRVRTADGLEGWGQTSPYLADQSVPALHAQVAKWFLGRDPWDLEAIVDALVRAEYKFYGTALFRALCGVDTAIWDLLGKSVGLPVYKLIGGAVRTSIPVYGSSMSRTISPEDEAERMQGLMESNGFRAFKLRIASVMGADQDAWPGRTKAIICTVRESLGDGVEILADANGGYSAAQAIRVGRLLEEHGYFHFEEPCPFPQLENTAKVAAALDIPVAGGEQDNSLEQFHRMITMNAVDIVQPDIGYLGGISRARKVVGMAEAAGIPCTPHCANQSLLQVFTLHLAASSPAVSQFQEWSIEDTAWTKNLFHPVPTVVGGAVEISSAPGWGIEVDPDYLAMCRQEISR